MAQWSEFPFASTDLDLHESLSNGSSLVPRVVADADEPWEECLIPEDLKFLPAKGLGKAIDATVENPWKNKDKTPYQAREICSVDDLHPSGVFNHLRSFEERTENYSEQQIRIEGKVKFSPNSPIEGSVAADAKRERAKTTVIKGITITTRIISFETNSERPTKFENALEEWVTNKGCKQHVQPGKQYNESTTKYCRDFLASKVGCATHYISGITLGAMMYKTASTSRSSQQFSFSADADVLRITSTKVASAHKKSVLEHRQHYEVIGMIPPGDSNQVNVRTTNEDVIDYTLTALTDLVRSQELRGHLQQAIQHYISLNSPTKRGPFRIKFQSSQSEDSVYWKVSSELAVVGTVDKSAASDFYIKPDAHCPLRQGFFITTNQGNAECYLRPTSDDWVSGTGCTIEVREQCRRESCLKLVNRVTHSEETILAAKKLFPKFDVHSDRFLDSFFIRPCFYSRFFRRRGFRKPCIAMVREEVLSAPEYSTQFRRKSASFSKDCSMLFKLEIGQFASFILPITNESLPVVTE